MSAASHVFLSAPPLLEIRTTLRSRTPYASHFHDEFCIGAVIQGQTRLTLAGREYLLRQGDLVLIAPGAVHSCNPVGSRERGYHMLHIDQAWFYRWCAERLGQSRFGVVRPVIRDRALFDAVAGLADSASARLGRPEDRLDALLLTAHRNFDCFGPAQARDIRLQSLLPNAGDVSDKAAVADLAAVAGLRRESFSRAVRKVTGLPPSAYLHCLRLAQGRKLLREGAGIAEAALETGYADQSHFHRMFARFYSVTPGVYRRRGSHMYKK